jgi:hypothetical protein
MFPFMTRPPEDFRRAQSVAAGGVSDYEIARRTGVPRSTIQRWRGRGPPDQRRVQQPWTVDDLPGGPYAYLLGQYLGDGTIYATGRRGRDYALRISSDAL